MRATRARRGFHDGLRLHLVETSDRLRAAQAARLAEFDPSWHARFGEVPSGPLLLIANEFFDALPAHQLIATARGWVERCVDLDDEGRLAFRLGRTPILRSARDLPDAPPGTVAEVSPARSELARAIGRRIADDGGVALVIDYGAWAEGPTGDTLQATRRHAPCDPLDAPGTADLTTHVDFRALAGRSRGGAAVYGPVPQGTFLGHARHPPAHREADRTGDAGSAARVARGPVPPDRRERHGRAVQGAGARRGPRRRRRPASRADAVAMLTAASLSAPSAASATASSPAQAA